MHTYLNLQKSNSSTAFKSFLLEQSLNTLVNQTVVFSDEFESNLLKSFKVFLLHCIKFQDFIQLRLESKVVLRG